MNPAPDLRSYLTTLRTTHPNSLMEVSRAVTAGEEISSVVKALEPYGAPAVMFENVKDSPLPVLMGLFGTRARIAEAIGTTPDDALDHVLSLQAPDYPVARVAGSAPVQEVVVTCDDVDLGDLPFATHSRDDAGAYITAGVVLAKHPVTGKINTGMYRLMITGKNTITVNAAPDHDLGRIFAAARELGQSVPIAVVIGHHPAYAIASQLKNPATIDAHELAGALLREPLQVVSGVSVDLEVPAGAEIVLEGIVDPGHRVEEGPFGEFSYYYGAAAAPVCTVTAVTRRSDAIFQDLHPTHAEHLCLWLFPGREARLLEAVRRAVPTTKAVRIPFYGGSFSAYLSVSKLRDGDGKQALLAAFAVDHFLKHVIVVDEDIDVNDDTAVLWSLNVRFQAERDLLRIPEAKGIRMDPSARQFKTFRGTDTTTDKLGFDTTRPLAPEFPVRADLPHPGFESISLSDYLGADDILSVAAFDEIINSRRE